MRALLCLLLLGSCLFGCYRDVGRSTSNSRPRPVQAGSAPRFTFTDTAGNTVSNHTLRGRISAVAFVTTYDLSSQALVQRLEELRGTIAPRINVLAVVLEAPNHAELAAAFKETLHLGFSVALADYYTRKGKSDFGRLDTVPTLVVLDRQGRVIGRREGMISTVELRDLLTP